MNDQTTRHERALNIFRAEEREQQLASQALRNATASTPSVKPKDGSLEHVGDASITNAYNQLQAARADAAQLAATDPELARLNAQLDGVTPAEAKPSKPNDNIVDAEYVEIPRDKPSTTSAEPAVKKG